MSDTLTVREILTDWLKEHGYDGLYCDECGCEIDDLAPCDESCVACRPGYKWPCTCGKPREHEYDFYVCPTRPPKGTGCPAKLKEGE